MAQQVMGDLSFRVFEYCRVIYRGSMYGNSIGYKD